jgi:competence protein ComEC
MGPVPHQHRHVTHPLALFAAACALGILASQLCLIPVLPPVLVGTLASVLAFIALLKQSTIVATILLTLAVLLAGASLASLERQSVLPDRLKRLLVESMIAPGDPVELTGVMDRAPEFAPESFYFTLQVERIRLRSIERNASGAVRLLAPLSSGRIGQEYEALELRYGARIRVMTELRRADNFRNPGVSSFTEYLERKGYDATGFVKSPLLIQRLDDTAVFLPLAWLYAWRRELEEQINSRFAPETAGVLDAALLGNRYNLSPTTAERFREGGTFHVLVISGLHISFIGGCVFLLARRITKKRGLQFVLSTTVLWCYALAVGAESSVVRAAFMFTIVTFAPIVSRRATSLNALGAAALILLVWRPQDLFDPSFELTFLSVVAIVILAWPLLQKMSAIGSWKPTRETPYPLSSPLWLRSFCETLFWSERQWREELRQTNYSYKLFKAPLAARLERYHLQRLARHAFGAIVVSASVQLTLLPLLVIYFHRLSLAAIVLNIGVSLLMAMLGIVAVVALIFGQVSAALAAPLISLANGLNWLMVHSVDPLARAGVASLRLPEYSGRPATIYVLYYLPLAILALLLARWNPSGQSKIPVKKRKGLRLPGVSVLAQAIALAVVVAHPLSAGRPDGLLRFDFLDVGQGDSALVTMPDGSTLLVDGGGRPNFLHTTGQDTEGETFERETRSIGEAVVSEYLWWRGLDHVDYILATHADADHINGLNDIARNFSVRAALVGRTPRDDPEYEKFSETVTAQGISLRVIGTRDVLRFGQVTATVLWPLPTVDRDAPSRNNDSVVLRFQYGERTILLTGDIERGAEAAMLSRHEDLRADVIKVAHHGSKTSSTDAFVAATHPRFAIISVGQTSVFGHPHRDVVERWQGSGAEVLTTGQSGTITVTTNGQDLQLGTFVHK